MRKKVFVVLGVACFFALVTFVARVKTSNPWEGVESGPYRVFYNQLDISMLDVLPDEQLDSYGHVVLFVRDEGGEVFVPLMYRRSGIAGGGGTRDDVSQVLHTLSKDKTSFGEYGWSDFPAPVGEGFTEYIILYRGPYKRGASAGQLHEGWNAASYSLSDLHASSPKPKDFVHQPETLVGSDWIALFRDAESKRYEYRAN